MSAEMYDQMTVTLVAPSRKIKRDVAGRVCPMCERRLWWEDVVAAHVGPHTYWIHVQCAVALVQQSDHANFVDPAHVSDDGALD